MFIISDMNQWLNINHIDLNDSINPEKLNNENVSTIGWF
jgi:hypothetical protein